MIVSQDRPSPHRPADAKLMRNFAARTLDLRPVDLVEMVKRASALRAGTGNGHAIRVDADEPGPQGLWDATRLERVVDNLLSWFSGKGPNRAKAAIHSASSRPSSPTVPAARSFR